MNWLLGVASGVIVAAVVVLLGWFFTPLGNRLSRHRTRVTNDHGIAIRVYTNPDEMRDLSTDELLGSEPRYLVGQNFYLQRPSPPDAPGDTEEWWRWAKRHGGEDVYASHVLVLLQATLDRTVAVRPPIVKVTSAPVEEGIVCGPEGQGGNGLLVRRFYIDLDEANPKAQFIDAQNQEGDGASFRMSKGETVGILAIAAAQRGRHEWFLELPLLVDGQDFTLRVDLHRRPFVTVGPAGIPSFYWVSDERRWI